jgi:hypothetical protein
VAERMMPSGGEDQPATHHDQGQATPAAGQDAAQLGPAGAVDAALTRRHTQRTQVPEAEKQGPARAQKRPSARSRAGSRALKVIVSIVAAIIAALAADYFYVNQPLITTAGISIDTAQSRQGTGSVAWDFVLQPAHRFSLIGSKTVGGFVHFEVRPDANGRINGVDWRNYYAVKFFAMTSVESLPITEINLFVGLNYTEYTFRSNRPLVLDTRWRGFTIPLSGFFLASWDAGTNSSVPDLSDVTAFGLDEKTSSNTLTGRIWVDYFRLIDRNGKETLLSDCDHLQFKFQGRELEWIVGGRQYG